jgi:hypothetical protein
VPELAGIKFTADEDQLAGPLSTRRPGPAHRPVEHHVHALKYELLELAGDAEDALAAQDIGGEGAAASRRSMASADRKMRRLESSEPQVLTA